MGRFEEAKERYAAWGIDVEAALTELRKVRVSMHCWQGDDVLGFDSDSLSGVLRLPVIIRGEHAIRKN
mgnify:CR=1 FL=1